jgi:RHH-type proline utilization regulon transcriptional repressor/proline dehydrogenase/delta 1-pyrroline-5-carboxylate dehydrogenase
MLAKTIRTNIESMAQQFIIGDNIESALKVLTKLRKKNFAFTVDILGEATVSEEEAEQYQRGYLELLQGLQREEKRWKSLGETESDLDWGHTSKLYVSIKPSSLYSQATPADFDGSIKAICERFEPILHKSKEIEAFVRIDMEQYEYKDMTLEVFRRLRSSPEFRDYPQLGIVLQSYLRDTDRDFEDLLEWAKYEGLPFSIRLVKGAYWDYETVTAKQNGWEMPIYTIKAETDAAFERQAKKILENHDICHLACGSHNIRSISAVLEMAKTLKVPENRYEFQVLYGMAEPVRKALVKVAKRVRLYCPYGELLPGMAYLVRRLLENTANESFLRQSFAENMETEKLLEDPAKVLERRTEKPRVTPASELQASKDHGPGPFTNEPSVDFTRPDARSAFPEAIDQVRVVLGRTYPLLIGDKEIKTEDTLPSINPAEPAEIVGHVCQAGKQEIDSAIASTQKGFPAWRDTFSMDIGLRILERASKIQTNQTGVKKVIAEMGGKNAMIVDDDADLDEAVVHLLHSAFGFQGQKCSACFRHSPGTNLRQVCPSARGGSQISSDWSG